VLQAEFINSHQPPKNDLQFAGELKNPLVGQMQNAVVFRTGNCVGTVLKLKVCAFVTCLACWNQMKFLCRI